MAKEKETKAKKVSKTAKKAESKAVKKVVKEKKPRIKNTPPIKDIINI